MLATFALVHHERLLMVGDPRLEDQLKTWYLLHSDGVSKGVRPPRSSIQKGIPIWECVVFFGDSAG